MKHLAGLNSLVSDWNKLSNKVFSSLELLDLALMEQDQDLILNIKNIIRL